MVDKEIELAALQAYAEMMNTLKTDCLEPFLADDLKHNSQWVFSEIIGKNEYLDFGRFSGMTSTCRPMILS